MAETNAGPYLAFQAKGPHTIGSNSYDYVDIFCQDTGAASDAIAQGPGISTNLTQIAADGLTLKASSDNAADVGQFLTIQGVQNRKRVSHQIQLNGTNSVATTGTFDYFEFATLSNATSGAVTIKDVNDNTIIVLAAGTMVTPIAHYFGVSLRGLAEMRIHHFNARLTTYTADATIELRVYNDLSAARDLTMGYAIRQAITTVKANGLDQISRTWGEISTREDPGSYACVVSSGNTSTFDCNLSLSVG